MVIVGVALQPQVVSLSFFRFSCQKEPSVFSVGLNRIKCVVHYYESNASLVFATEELVQELMK
jgi:hypothetical protein